jgi:hypothetical protein
MIVGPADLAESSLYLGESSNHRGNVKFVISFDFLSVDGIFCTAEQCQDATINKSICGIDRIIITEGIVL